MHTISDSMLPVSNQIHVIDLVSITDSKILRVNLYPTRAAVTRLFKVTTKCGSNRINIKGLPTSVDQDSIRVEGKGSVTIYDVIFSTAPHSSLVLPKSSKLKGLLHKRKQLEKALGRCTESLLSLKTYLGTLNTQHVDASQLSQIIESYNAAAEQLDDKSLSLEEQISAVNSEIKAEQRRPTPGGEDLLRTNVEIDLVAAASGDNEIILTYATEDQCASWEARYDVHANLEAAKVLLVYKALISQRTGESWDNIPLTLQTTSPMFGADVGSLTPWTIHLQRHQEIWTSAFLRPSPAAPEVSGMRKSTTSLNQNGGGVDETPPTIEKEVVNGFASVTSKRDIFATFQIPNLITIPSDGAAHNVTIVELALEMSTSWIAVPKKGSGVHLNAKITNASDYGFLRGTANMFVDGTFTSRSSMPMINPQEAFELDLGLDPSVRITYHQREKNFTQIGESWKQTTARRYTQRISVLNNKAVPVEVKVVDQIPVSEDPSLTVKLVTPELTRPNKNSSKAPTISTGEGVLAQWEGAGVEDLESLGKDGNVSWRCSIPPQGIKQLTLQWEVTAPEVRHTIVGL